MSSILALENQLHAELEDTAEVRAIGMKKSAAGEDKTVRVWSAEDGKLVQVLRESPSSLVTLAFSPDGRYIAATSEKNVMVWRRHAAN